MAKIALLIGVSEYGAGLSGLPGTQADIRAMQRVLENPQIGGFDAVEVLSNPDRDQMERAIETLFMENRSSDDLILLYFSGHGFKDDDGTFYFTNCITEKDASGQRIRTSTAVSCRTLQGYMSHFKSKSKRQVLILDCCFSGAFADGMKGSGEETIDISTQLGSEGRAVLTSSTAMQESYEKERGGIYTRYLVQGLETGAADRDEDGYISVDELHEYAKEKVQEASPRMKPEIYPVKEGYKILLARAPQGDPKLVYRKELDGRAKQKRGKLSRIDQQALEIRRQELELSPGDAAAIAQEVLQPYQVFWAKVDNFAAAVQEVSQVGAALSLEDIDDLQYFQRVLKLRDEDIAPALETYQVNLTPSVQPVKIKPAPQPPAPQPAPPPKPPAPADTLSSEKNIDYTRLRDLLKAQKWQEADQETWVRMLQAVGRKDNDWIRAEELQNFPCQDLKTIDSLWVKHSNGHFGFSVQKQIWQECGSPTSSGKDWDRFCVKVGWKNKANAYVSYSDLKKDLSLSPTGELPWMWVLGVGGLEVGERRGVFRRSLFSHPDL